MPKFGENVKTAVKPYEKPDEPPKVVSQPRGGKPKTLDELLTANLAVAAEFQPYSKASGGTGGGFIDHCFDDGSPIQIEFCTLESGESVKFPFAYKKFKEGDDKYGFGLALSPKALAAFEHYDRECKRLQLERFETLHKSKVRDYQDEATRKIFLNTSYKSRISYPKEENEGKYAPVLRLANKDSQPPKVQLCETIIGRDGKHKIRNVRDGTIEDLAKGGGHCVPVIETRGGMWLARLQPVGPLSPPSQHHRLFRGSMRLAWGLLCCPAPNEPI